ncbi:hypothetical protein PHYSODRAFT_468325 [Phytophthora sojae]|uniref:Uncharacterized protein n=1 Tax=Phytophthora sojae (strain P6497) TaxID=1094619 RepID=G4YKK5_PHYSP|nr:hypothetical protein PHYSODRAFT_468325 [Phytophthora sojae]EGZ28837.1 hypothetical protein PHYSODRAFT_468325 [Phytophthora sojae]|eukprot:XP_009516112.1 hypothetical protein PHYSODRAFT_468325 [Phytophthora sojae]
MSDGHLYLSALGGADYAVAGRRAWFDSTHQSVLLLSTQSLTLLQQLPLDASLDPVEAATAVPVPTNVATLYDFNEPDAGRDRRSAHGPPSITPIVLLQLSVDGQYLAIQRSDIEVQVLHRATRASYWVLCKSKAGNRILHGGVIWNTHSVKPTSSQDLFLVTKMGLEHYRVSSKRRSCALHKSVGLYVHEFWYAASHGVLLLSSGSRANEIVPFLLHGAYVEKLPKLLFSTAVSKQDLHLVSLYGDMYVVYSDTRSTKLLLYLVGRTKVTCVRSLNLLLPPGTALEYSVVDNLLVCHSLDFNVSLFFDIKCDGNISDPFSAPLPISARPPGHPPPESKQHEVVPSFTRWRFHAPNLVQRSFAVNGREQIEIRKLQVNLTEVCKTCEHHREILPFLLRRGDHEMAKSLVLQLVRSHIVEQQASLSAIAQLLATVQTMYGSERRNKVLLLTPISLNTSRICAITRCQWRTSREYVAVAECFVVTGEPNKLYQFLHYHVLADSVELADLMVRHGCTYPALMQVGLDMYYRLREICPLVRTLLDIGQAGQAIEIAWRNMGLTSCDAAVLPGVAFFDSLVKASTHRSSLQVTQMLGNLLLFLKVWDPVCLQQSGTRSISNLASCAAVPFPDDLVPIGCRKKLRAAFGFFTEEP